MESKRQTIGHAETGAFIHGRNDRVGGVAATCRGWLGMDGIGGGKRAIGKRNHLAPVALDG
jgi:hypothetical protein